MGLANDLDLKGKVSRQRKVRRLIMDTREPDEVSHTLLTGQGYTVTRRTMLVGDWGWDLRPESFLGKRGYIEVLVERKTLADLRDTERLIRQLKGAAMLTASRDWDRKVFFVVLIEHRFDTDRKRRWSDKAVQMAKLSLQLDSDVYVTECAENGIADGIDNLYQWSNKAKHQLGGETDNANE